MKRIKWISIFMAGLAAGGGLGTGALAIADIGDAIYETGGQLVEISGPDAACVAQCLITSGAWDGAM